MRPCLISLLLLFFMTPTASTLEVKECDSCLDCTIAAMGNDTLVLLTRDLNASAEESCILPTGKDVILDCQGHTIRGFSSAIAPTGDGSLQVRDCDLINNEYGFFIYDKNASILMDNVSIIENEVGISFSDLDYTFGRKFPARIEMRDSRMRDNANNMLLDINAGSEIRLTHNSIHPSINGTLIVSKEALDPAYAFLDDNDWGVDGCGALLGRFEDYAGEPFDPHTEWISVSARPGEVTVSKRCDETKRLEPELTFRYFEDDGMARIYLRHEQFGDFLDVKPITIEFSGGALHKTTDSGMATFPVFDELLVSGFLDTAVARFEGDDYFAPATAELDIVDEVSKDFSCELVYGDAGKRPAIDIVIVPLNPHRHIDPESEADYGMFYSDEAMRGYIMDELVHGQYGLFSTGPLADKQHLFNIWYYPGEIRADGLDSEQEAAFYDFLESVTGSDVWQTPAPTLEVCNTVQKRLSQACPIDKVVVLVNSDFRAVAVSKCAVVNPSPERGGARVTNHEMGHLFGLADEYTEEGMGDYPYANCAGSLQEAAARWASLVKSGQGGLSVGYYGGCSYTGDNVRPTQNSIMNDYTLLTDWRNGFGPFNEAFIADVLEGYLRRSTS